MRRRPVLVLAATGLALTLAWGAACWRYLVRPTVDADKPTDAAYVLASSGGLAAVDAGTLDRLPGATIVVSTTPELMTIPDYQQLCAGRATTKPVVCTTPVPPTTRGEARVFATLATQRGWTSVTVVTHRTHLSRSRMLMERCFPGEVRMKMRSTEGKRALAYAVLYETGAYAKSQVLRGC